MRSLPRIALWSLLVLAAPALSGCANFDPDNLDIFGLNEKKKLPGERKDVFPEGVPGVSQGIPPEYRMGAQTAAGADAAAAAAAPQQPAPAAPVAQEKPKPKPARTVRRAAPKPAAAAPVAPVQAQDAPAAQTPQQQPASSGWPAPAQGTTSSSGSSAWPAPQPSGTFQR